MSRDRDRKRTQRKARLHYPDARTGDMTMRVFFDFMGREVGALGATAHYCAGVEADTYADAARRLYERFEHVCPLRSWTASRDGVTVDYGEGWHTYPRKEG